MFKGLKVQQLKLWIIMTTMNFNKHIKVYNAIQMKPTQNYAMQKKKK